RSTRPSAPPRRPPRPRTPRGMGNDHHHRRRSNVSTPYRKLGLLHQKWRGHFGGDGGDVLVVQGASKAVNPSLSDRTLAAQRAADPTAAGAEWDALFRSDIGA